MSITRDMVATYRNPGQVFTRLSAMGQREDRALFWLIAGCGLTFVGQWPKISREAFLNGQDFTESLTGPLMAWVFFAPLLFYILSGVLHLIARVFGGKGKSYGALACAVLGVLCLGAAALAVWPDRRARARKRCCCRRCAVGCGFFLVSSFGP